MTARDRVRTLGIVASLATVFVLAGPYVIVSGQEELLLAYYGAGPVGAVGIMLFALVCSVVLASIDRGNVDPGTLAGVAVALGTATTLLAVLWHGSIDPTVLYSFPQQYRWLEWHSVAVIAVSVAIPISAALYARDLFA